MHAPRTVASSWSIPDDVAFVEASEEERVVVLALGNRSDHVPRVLTSTGYEIWRTLRTLEEELRLGPSPRTSEHSRTSEGGTDAAIPGVTAEEILEALSRAHGLDAESIRADVEGFLAEMEAIELIKRRT